MVLQGNQVEDENWDVALFQELGSAPATFEAGAACDAYGLVAGHDAQHADVEQAYIQTRLGVTFPRGFHSAVRSLGLTVVTHSAPRLGSLRPSGCTGVLGNSTATTIR